MRKILQIKHLAETPRETLDLLVGYPGPDFIISADPATKELLPDLPAGCIKTLLPSIRALIVPK